MAHLYALLVGIDAYRDPVPALAGCRNDIARAAAYLHSHAAPGTTVFTRELWDGAATRAAVEDTFRSHLGQAGAGDTALFWFSGHGSTRAVDANLWHLEPTGEMQTLVCVDSRHGAEELLDKELALLVREVAAGGAHVVLVLDCCYAGGANRAPAGGRMRWVRHLPAARVRWIEPQPTPLTPASLPPALRLRDGTPAPAGPALSGRPDHVALAACHSFQVAHEVFLSGEPRGLFSLGLLNSLNRLGPEATYRELITAVRAYVENVLDSQVPALYPLDDELADTKFLGGHVRRSPAAMVMRYARGAWEIDAGACHGLVAGAGEDTTRVAVHGSDPAQEARIVRVFTERSTVEPLGWRPDPGRQYRITVTSVPLPATTVAIDPATVTVAAALRVAAPGGRPSPHLRMVDPGDPHHLPELTVCEDQTGTVQILDQSRRRLAPGRRLIDPGDAARVVADLEHIARWRQVKALANPLSRLANGVRVEVVQWRSGERTAPLDRPALRTDDDGVLRLSYQRGPGGWSPPTVFIRAHNRTGRRLYCVLLNLTDQFKLDPGLLPGSFVGPGQAAAIADGEPIEFSLPPDRAVRPGASVRDWLLLLAAEAEFSSLPFWLARLGEPLAGQGRGDRVGAGLSGVLDRLGFAAMSRDAVRPATAAHDWTTQILEVVTRVPTTNDPAPASGRDAAVQAAGAAGAGGAGARGAGAGTS